MKSLAGTDRCQRGHAAAGGCAGAGVDAGVSLQARFGFAAITAVIMGAELRDRPQQPGNRRCSFAPPGRTASMTGTQTCNARHLIGRGSRPPAPRRCHGARSVSTSIGGMPRPASRAHDRRVARLYGPVSVAGGGGAGGTHACNDAPWGERGLGSSLISPESYVWPRRQAREAQRR